MSKKLCPFGFVHRWTVFETESKEPYRICVKCNKKQIGVVSHGGGGARYVDFLDEIKDDV